MHLETNERQLTSDTLLRVVTFEGYDFAGNPGHIHWQVCTYTERLWYYADGTPVEDGNGVQAYTFSKVVKAEGLLELTTQVVNQWGADDQLIFDYIVAALGL